MMAGYLGLSISDKLLNKMKYRGVIKKITGIKKYSVSAQHLPEVEATFSNG